MKKYVLKICLMLFMVTVLIGCGEKKENTKTDDKAIVLDDKKQEKKENDNSDNDEDENENNDDEKNEDENDNDEKDESLDTDEDVDKSTDSENEESDTETKDKRVGDASSEKKENNKNSLGLSPFEEHGKLNISGTQIVDKNGKPFQFKGVSTHGLSWFPEYVNPDAFKTMRDSWGVNLVRLAMYTGEGGYCTGANQNDLNKLIDAGVSYATSLGMYVIIDWHILSDNNPNMYKDDAKTFFNEMSIKYAKNDNVIYEICNEPNGDTSWSDIKKYALEIIPVIKNNNPDAIIVVGTPTWSQDVDKAAADPIEGYTNIMYTLHFYADTHRDQLREKMTGAIKSGIPIFVTEFGICDASGNGSINIDEANKWIDLMEKNGVGYCIWNLSNKAESSALINNNCNKKSDWTMDDLSDEGRWYLGVLGGSASSDVSNAETNSSTDESKEKSKSDSSDSKSEDSQSDSKKIENSGKNMTIKQTGSWNDGKKDYCQYTINIQAKEADINGWKIKIDFDNDVTVDQSWSANYETKSKKSISITPVDFNKNIKKGEKVELGFIVSYDGDLSISDVSIE